MKNKSETKSNRLSLAVLLQSRLFHLLFIVLIGALVYANTIHAPFYFDDKAYIGHEIMRINLNDILDSSSLIRGAALDDTFKSGLLTRRFAFLTFMLNYKLHGLSVTGYHLVNIFIHLVSALFVYALISRLWHTPFIYRCFENMDKEHRQLSCWTAFLGAALFVVHPVNTQTIIYIVQRFASLATFLYLFAILSYLSSILRREQITSVIFYSFALIATILAMFTKEISFTLPAVMLLCDCLFLQRPLRKTLLSIAPFLLTMAIIPWNLYQAKILLASSTEGLAGSMSTLAGGEVLSRHDYFITEMRVIVTYIRLLFFPANQNLDYDYPVYMSLFTPPVFASFLLLLSIIVIGFVLLRASATRSGQLAALYRLLAFGIFWFFITLSVESSIQPIENVIYEHRLYLPFFGFTLTAVCAGAVLWLRVAAVSPKTAKLLPIVGLITIVILGYVATVRNTVWQNEITLWEDVVSKSPQKVRGIINLGRAYLENEYFDEAQQKFLDATKLEPRNWRAYAGLGQVYEKKQQYREALLNYSTCLALEQKTATVQALLGDLYLKLGMEDDAYSMHMKMVSLNARNFESLYNLGLICAKRKQYAEALLYYRKALELAPNKKNIYADIGKVYHFQGNLREAILAYQAAISDSKNNFDAHYNLGLIYDQFGDYNKALSEYQQSEKVRSDYAPLYNNLGVTYSNLQQYNNALKSFMKVLVLDPANLKAKTNIELINAKIGTAH